MKIAYLLLILASSCLTASELKIYDDKDTSLMQATSEPSEIAALLSEIDVRFEQWEASHPLTQSATEEDIQAAYKVDIERLKEENHFQSVDVIRMYPEHPNRIAFREKFLNEHTHDEPEVRFFVEGSGIFYLHVNAKVFAVECTRGDLISIPVNTPHWFDMGEAPFFTAIRFFTRMEGWIPYFTGSEISKDFIQ